MVENFGNSQEKIEDWVEQFDKNSLDKFNGIYSRFKRFNGYEFEDSGNNAIKLSCNSDETKRGLLKTITIEVDERKSHDLEQSLPFLGIWHNFLGKYQQEIFKQGRRQQYTKSRHRKKVNRVRYSISVNERRTSGWKKVAKFHVGLQCLDINNYPNEIRWVKWKELQKILGWYDTFMGAVWSYQNQKVKECLDDYQKLADFDHQEADNLLQENGLA